MENSEKKKLIIFIVIAYGFTYLMGILMYVGYKNEIDLNQFALTQMLYPAAGVMFGMLLTNPKEKPIPKAAFIVTLILTGICMLFSILSIAFPLPDLELAGMTIAVYYLIAQYILMPVALAIYILLWTTGRTSRENAGFSHKNIGKGALMIALFLALYIARLLLSFLLEQLISGDGVQQFQEWLTLMATPTTWINIIALPFNFFFVFPCFLGEEYGWRYYLQPLLQKKFGLRKGVLILGIVWGLWHLPMDLMFYTTTTGPQMLINQIIVCVGYAIFFGYAYMKTQNIWVPVIIHYLNNNLIPVISGDYSSDVLENQSIAWSDLPIAFVLMLIYMVFIFAKEYRTKTTAEAEQ